MQSLLMVERFILEVVGNELIPLSEIKRRTQLKENLLISVVHNLVQANLLQVRANKYALVKDPSLYQTFNSKDKVKNEVKEIFVNLLNAEFDKGHNKGLGLKKVYLTDKDEEVLRSKLNEIDEFLSACHYKNNFLNPNMRVFFWGLGQYSEIIKEDLKQVG